MKKIMYFFITFLFVPLFAMEQPRVRRPMPPLIPAREEQPVEKKFVILELIDNDGEVIYKIQVPYSFANQASVLNNLLKFHEEEEGKEIVLPLSAGSITLDQFKELEIIAHQTLVQQGSVKKSVKFYVKQWYPNNLTKLTDLITVANYIGHEKLLHYAIKNFEKILKKLVETNEWDIVFQLGQTITIPDLQQKIIAKIVKASAMKYMMIKLSPIKSIGELPVKVPIFSSSISGKKWLAATFKDLDKQGSIVVVHDLETLQQVNEFRTKFNGFNPPDFPLPMKISPSGNFLLIGLADGSLVVYNIETGELVKEIVHRTYLPTIRSVCFSPDEQLVAIGSNNFCCVLDIKTYEIKHTIEGKNINNVAFSADSRFLALETGSKLIIGDLQQNFKYMEVIGKDVTGKERSIKSVVGSPNNKYFAVAWDNGDISIIDIKEIKIIMSLVGDSKPFYHYYPSLAFSSDGKFLITGFADFNQNPGQRNVKIWDMTTDKLVKSIPGNYHNIYSVSFSPDGNKIAYISQQKTWDKDGILYINSLAISPQVQHLPLNSILLLWYFAEQEQKGRPIIIPKGYEEYFLMLPEEIRDHFYFRNIKLGGRLLPFKAEQEEEPQLPFIKEQKRKEVTKGEGKNQKRPLRPFKRFKKEGSTLK